MNLLEVMIIGYCTALVGFVLALGVGYCSTWISRKSLNFVLGSTGGLLIAFICFELVPTATSVANPIWCLIVVLIAIIFMLFLEKGIVYGKSDKNISMDNTYWIITIVASIAIGINNLPEGVALGSLLNENYIGGVKFAVILALHCIPEGLAIMIPLIQSHVSTKKEIAVVALIALPMCIGCVVGYIMTDMLTVFMPVFVSFASGTMLYVACGKVMPMSKDIEDVKSCVVGDIVGFVVGVIIVTVL